MPDESPSVLIIDDDPEFRDLVVTAVEDGRPAYPAIFFGFRFS